MVLISQLSLECSRKVSPGISFCGRGGMESSPQVSGGWTEEEMVQEAFQAGEVGMVSEDIFILSRGVGMVTGREKRKKRRKKKSREMYTFILMDRAEGKSRASSHCGVFSNMLAS
ncbi:hypothetical protein NPIL_554841 [Nephila pilipes]|uniref:Uncharacterized protein n=1 Tax=Nephila pilipes TaxID=299642 RepID=A0A8X6MZB5_NEPPI|nr:hypothetical protein NPIL_554841 [Nephila pilipes]